MYVRNINIFFQLHIDITSGFLWENSSCANIWSQAHISCSPTVGSGPPPSIPHKTPQASSQHMRTVKASVMGDFCKGGSRLWGLAPSSVGKEGGHGVDQSTSVGAGQTGAGIPEGSRVDSRTPFWCWGCSFVKGGKLSLSCVIVPTSE